jgi:hypothetical protein
MICCPLYGPIYCFPVTAVEGIAQGKRRCQLDVLLDHPGKLACLAKVGDPYFPHTDYMRLLPPDGQLKISHAISSPVVCGKEHGQTARLFKLCHGIALTPVDGESGTSCYAFVMVALHHKKHNIKRKFRKSFLAGDRK